MRKLMIAASAATLLAVSSMAALAAEANGKIQSIDPTAGTVTLADGTTYQLPAQFDAASLQVGEQVTITYDQGSGGTMTATDVKPQS
jgi:Cu/Ag efflux protein CusF